MSVVFLSLFLNFELIQQAALVNFVFFLNIVKILKITFWTFGRKNCIFLNLWALFSLKPCKTFIIAQCKQPRLVKPWLYFDINFTFRSTGTALVQVKRAFKNYFLWHKKKQLQKSSRQALHESFFIFQYKCAEVLISPISKPTPPFSAVSSFSKNISNPRSGSTKWETNILSITTIVLQN